MGDEFADGWRCKDCPVIKDRLSLIMKKVDNLCNGKSEEARTANKAHGELHEKINAVERATVSKSLFYWVIGGFGLLLLIVGGGIFGLQLKTLNTTEVSIVKMDSVKSLFNKDIQHLSERLTHVEKEQDREARRERREPRRNETPTN